MLLAQPKPFIGFLRPEITEEKAMEKTLKTKHDSPRKGDVKHSYGDPAKATEQLKFKATTTLQQGLNQLT